MAETLQHVGIDRTGKNVIYYTPVRGTDPRPLIGKFIRINGQLRKVIDAYRWILSNGEESTRYCVVVRH